MASDKQAVLPGGGLRLRPDLPVSYRGRPYKVVRVIGLECVLIQSEETDETERAHPTELRHISDVEVEGPQQPGENTRDLQDFTKAEWDEATRLKALLDPLVIIPQRTRADVAAVAKSEGVNPSTVYEWLKTYQENGHTSSLIKRKRGRQEGTKLLNPVIENLIEDVIEKAFLNSRQLVPKVIVEEVERRCKTLPIKAPHPNTIRARLAALPQNQVKRRRGNREKADKASRPVPGTFDEANAPLACVQIDHCKLDVRGVDDNERQAVKKDIWLTLAIDVWSRMIVGYFLSYLKPSAFGTGVCLFMAMMRKDELLTKLGLTGSWPVFGKMRKVHADNAKEFKGKMLLAACDEHHIDLQLRPIKTPRYGGHIERMIGNVNREMHKKRGTTHSNPRVSPDYDSDADAIHTLSEIEIDLVDWIVNDYHVNFHSGIKTTPLRRWTEGLRGSRTHPGIGLPDIPTNPEKLRLDFLPCFTRTIQTYGVEYEKIFYYHEVLSPWMDTPNPENPTKKRKFLFREDPRNITKIWFFDPAVKRYFVLPDINPSHRAISRSEFDAAERQLRAEGASHVDADSIFACADRIRAREAVSLAKTKEARQQSKRKIPRGAAPKSPPATAPGSALFAETTTITTSKTQASPSPEEDPFALPVTPFQDIEVSR